MLKSRFEANESFKFSQISSNPYYCHEAVAGHNFCLCMELTHREKVIFEADGGLASKLWVSARIVDRWVIARFTSARCLGLWHLWTQLQLGIDCKKIGKLQIRNSLILLWAFEMFIKKNLLTWRMDSTSSIVLIISAISSKDYKYVIQDQKRTSEYKCYKD